MKFPGCYNFYEVKLPRKKDFPGSQSYLISLKGKKQGPSNSKDIIFPKTLI